MRVLFSVPRYHPNHDGMVAGLQAAGHEVAFLVRDGHPTERHRPGVAVTDLYRAAGMAPGGRHLMPPLRFLRRYLRQTRPDVVVARNPDRASYALFLACRLRRIPFLLYVQRASGLEEIRAGRRLLLALGLWPRHTVNAIAGEAAHPVRGKTLDFLPFAMETDGFGSAAGPEAPPLRVLAVGKLDQPRKNHAALVRALAPLLRDGRIALTLLGLRDPGGSDAFAALGAEIARQGVGDRVRILENLGHAESRRTYCTHELLVLASSRERASVAPVEAMAAGLAVIAGSDNGTNFFIREGETGFVFPDGDFATMARLVERLADDPALARRMGEAGRRRIEAEFGPAAYARRFEAIVARRFGR